MRICSPLSGDPDTARPALRPACEELALLEDGERRLLCVRSPSQKARPRVKPVGGNPADGKAAARRRKAGASRKDAPPRFWRRQWLACAFRRFASLSFLTTPLSVVDSKTLFQNSGASAPREWLRMP